VRRKESKWMRRGDCKLRDFVDEGIAAEATGDGTGENSEKGGSV
jgi:hypothetical protein